MTATLAPRPPVVAPSPQRPAAYLANLAALYTSDPALGAEIDVRPFADAPPLEAARDGRPTVRLTADDGRPVYVHSRYRPAEEAAVFVRGLPAGAGRTFVLGGLGLGYHVAALAQAHDRPLVIVFEPDLALIKAALCVCDLSALLHDGRLILLTTADKALVHQRLTPCSADLLLGTRIASLPHAQMCRIAQQRQFQKLLAEFVAYSRLQLVTLLKVARTTFANVAFNLPHYLSHAGVEALAGRAADRPAILLAAGPSLARQLPLVRALRDRAVLIAVQTVFKLLRAADILPHFVTSLDYHEVSAEFFDGVADVGDCVLVAEPKAAWRVLDAYPGRKHVLRHDLVARLLHDAAPPRASLKAGSTVAHLSLYLAQHLGCDPIILVGQDLCFSQGLYYPPGTPVERLWAPELGRFNTVEMKQWERIVRNRPILQTVEDIHGRPAYSDDLLVSYAEQFQADFASFSARVIHAGEAGMKLAGTQVMSLAEAAERYCTAPLPAGLFAAPPTPTADLPRVRAELAARRAEVAQVCRIAREVDSLLERLSGLLDRPAQFNRLIARVDDLRSEMMQHELTYQMVVEVSQLADLRRYTADRRLEDIEGETVETARQRLARDREFVREFIDGCEFLERTLPEALRRLGEHAA